MIIINTMSLLKINKSCSQKRLFWGWLNVVFNKVDNQRRKEFGPDRVCAEWILRNGGAVRWQGTVDILRNYNALPPEGTKLILEEVDATGSSIMHYGFEHFVGCNSIKKINFHNCEYLLNPALGMLTPINKTLVDLQVSNCKNITKSGLLELKKQTNLKRLVLFDFPYVSDGDKTAVLEELTRALPGCNVSYK